MMKENNFYRELIFNSNFGYAYHKILLDDRGEPCDYMFIEANRTFSELTGLNHDEIQNKSITELITEIRKSEFNWIKYYGDIALNSGTDSFEQYSQELNKWYKVQVFSPEKFYFATIFTDITKERQSFEQLENFFSVNLDLLCIADMDGNLIRVNNSWHETLGYSIEFLEKSKFTDFIHPDDLDKTYAAMDQLSQGIEIINFVNRYRCQNGTYKFIEWRSRPVGRLIYAAARDISDRIELESELQVKNERYELAVLGSNDGLWDWDIKNDQLFLSARWKEIIGYKESELDNNYNVFDSHLHSEDYERVNKTIRDYIADITPEYNIEFRMRHKFGHYVWIQSKGIALRDEDGVAYRLAGSHSDISERKRAENNLNLAKETYKGILDSITELVYIQSTDGRFVEVNQAVIDNYGYPRERFIGSTPEFLSADELNDMKAIDEAIRQAVKGKKQSFEFWAKRYDGTIFPKEVNLTPGHFFGKQAIITVARDISISKNQETILKDSEKKYRLIAENADDVIWTLDVAGNFTYISPSITKLRGLTIEEAMKETVQETMPQKWADYVKAEQDRAVEIIMSGGKYPAGIHEIEQYHKDGYLIWVEMLVKGLYNENDQLIGVSGVSRDITRRKEAELNLLEYAKKLQEAITEQEKFFSIIASDLKIPISTFLSLTKHLSDNFYSFKIKELKEFGEELKSAASNLYSLLDNLLEWSKLKMGLTSCKREDCDATFIVNQIVESYSTLIAQKNLQINNLIPSQYIVNADPSLLNIIFRNLISNAFKYSADKGIINIGIYSKNYEWYFYVQDHGIGISADRLPELFSLVKISSNQDIVNSEFSSGLGLILCKEYVALHHGDIYVDSEVDIGSTFYFCV